MRPRIRREEGKSAGEALLGTQLQRIVVGPSGGTEPSNKSVNRWNRAAGSKWQTWVSIRLRLISIQVDVLLQPARSRIGDFKHCVRGQFVLCREMPLLHVRCHQVPIKRKEERWRLRINQGIWGEASG